MKIQNVITIDGKIVDKVFQKGDISVYEYDSYYDEKIIFFVKNEIVIFKQTIKADCSQNQGIISSVNFEGVKNE